MLNPLTIGIAVGYGFLLGVPLLLWVFLTGWNEANLQKRGRRIVIVWVLFGFLPVTTPIPMWLHVAWGMTLAGAMLAERRAGWSTCWRIAFIVLTVVVWVDEARYHVWWPLPTKQYSQLVLVADSLTAGMGFSREVTWPQRLRKATGWEILDLSEPGATVASARKQAALIPEGDTLVLMEIGGNDMLEQGDVSNFEQGLDRLLALTCRTGREVILFELPLPPFYQRFGEVQRRLARRYGVRLLPKRCFGGLLMPHGATVDGLHFSNSGHQRVAEFVESLLRGAMAKAG